MVLRHAIGRHASRRSLRPQCISLATPGTRRGLAAPSSGTFQYETSAVNGVKIASRDLPGPMTTLALVAKGGSRYQILPGIAEGLEKFAFRNTHRRSALRLQREAELFGASLFSYHTRESIVLGAKFFRDDLAYFVEVLNEVATQTKYIDYEFTEMVMDQIHHSQTATLASTRALATESAHALAFHRGLGEPVNPTSGLPLKKYLSHDSIGAYSTIVYQKPNVAIVANGAEHSDLSQAVTEYFQKLWAPEGADSSSASDNVLRGMEQTKYYGGEERIAHSNGNTMVLAFPGSSSPTGGFYKPEIAVLASLLGGKSTIKWSPGFSLLAKAAAKQDRASVSVDTASHIYSDAGLLTITMRSKDYPGSVGDTAKDAVAIIKSIADGSGLQQEDFAKAKAIARLKELEYGHEPMAGLELTGAGLIQSGAPYQLDESAKKIESVKMEDVKKAAKELLQFKACVSTVGDLFWLPYAEELGLQV